MKYSVTKVKQRLWSEIVSRTRNTSLYPYIYKSFWHSFLFPKNGSAASAYSYFSARPNLGAGIGHQMANWIAGYWWAKQFGVRFAHIPFSTLQWEAFLGFGEDEAAVDDLLLKGYKKVLLPLFAENRDYEVLRIKSILASYIEQKVVFVCEQDQFYKDQYGVIADIQRKFYSSKARNEDKLIYSKEYYNIAIHVRRGDIVIGQKNQNPNLLMRWQNNDYFVKVLSNVLKTMTKEKPIAIYLFSQGSKSDFEDFKCFPNLHFCLEMSARDSFLHMVFADLLITSKSSFSYKPALLNKEIKVCPKNFWHGYPETEDWILADENGNFKLKMNKVDT